MVALLDRLMPNGDARQKPDQTATDVNNAVESKTAAYVVDFDDDVPVETIERMKAAFSAEFASETWVTNRRES